jgi:hypothetical protein
MSHTLVAYNRGISPGWKWWQTILKIEISCSQWEGLGSLVFSFGFCRKGGGVILFRGAFPICFHCVPDMFPSSSPSSQCVPYDVPNSTLFSILYCLAIGSTSMYISWGGGGGGGGGKEANGSIFRHLCWGVPPMFQKDWWWANQRDPSLKKLLKKIKSSQVDYPSTLADSTLIILFFKMLRFSNFISSKFLRKNCEG